MALVLLVRHATTEVTGRVLSGWTPGHHLDGNGRAQAAGVGERLQSIRLAAVYSSPLERCAETAEAIAVRQRLTVREVEDLGEVRYGDWTGRPLRVLARTKLWRQVMRAPSQVRFPGGETLGEVQARGVAAVNEIAARHPRRTVAVCSHADVIRLLLAHYSGVHIDLFQRTAISPASVSAVVLEGGTPRILRVNDTGTFADLTPQKPAPRRPPARGPGPDVELDPVHRITVDAVGEPGHRTFYLQAGDADTTVTVVLEKEQARLLAASILEILQRVGKDPDLTAVPSKGLGLAEPIEPDWRAGRLSIGYQEDRDRLVLDVEELVPDPEEGEDELELGAEAEERIPAEIRLWATREQMLALARHTADVVQAGRPQCPFCGHPIDPEGHLCPATNGHREIGSV